MASANMLRVTNLFEKAERPAYIHVDLDRLTHNVSVLRKSCQNKAVGIMAVIKAGAYGHGSVVVGRHLTSIGVERLAVATVDEAIHLRNHGISAPVQVLGNVQAWEMSRCLQYSLIPTVSDQESILGMAEALLSASSCQENKAETSKRMRTDPDVGAVHIKIDTGMSRNGCQPTDFFSLYKKCEECGVPVEGAMTHFIDSWDDSVLTRQQLETFLNCVKPFRSRLKLHVANSGAIMNKMGTDLDIVRPGIALYGLPPNKACEKFQSFGLKPIGSVHGLATMLKRLDTGRRVGYSATWTCPDDTWIATIPVGYADGYWRHLSSDPGDIHGYVIRDNTGEKCEVVGRVSMDAITVRLPSKPRERETFTIMTADYDNDTSASGIASTVGTISYEVVTRLSVRYPRLFTKGVKHTTVPAVLPENY